MDITFQGETQKPDWIDLCHFNDSVIDSRIKNIVHWQRFNPLMLKIYPKIVVGSIMINISHWTILPQVLLTG